MPIGFFEARWVLRITITPEEGLHADDSYPLLPLKLLGFMKKAMKRWGWLVLIWVLSVGALGVVAWLLRRLQYLLH